jgi:hypothetical protein
MAKCGYCGTTILLGGKKAGGERFCNDQCLQKGVLLTVADQVPEEAVQDYIHKVHSGECPKCQGRGPVDVHTSHRVWSALVITSWGSRPQVCCQSCGSKSKIGDMFFSLLLGWWGFPWGLFITPVQVVRNLAGLVGGQDPSKPSEQLEKMLRLELAANIVQHSQGQEESPE